MRRTSKLASVILMTASVGCLDTDEPSLGEVESNAEVTPDISIVDGVEHTALAPVNLVPTLSCTPPSSSNCVNDIWMKQCGPKYWNTKQTCTQLNHQTAMQNFNWGQIYDDKIFDPKTETFLPAQKPPVSPVPTLFVGVPNSWAAQESKARIEAQKAVNPDWKTYKRSIGWLLEGVPVESCENYIYRSYYDVERWIDAINACKNDERCMVEASLYTMPTSGASTTHPGIGRRVLSDLAGVPLNDASHLGGYPLDMVRQSERDAFAPNYTIDQLPKNIFYANTEWFITPALLEAFPSNGVDGPREQVQKLLNELHRGSKLYQLDNSGTGFTTDADGYMSRHFADEWAFHRFGKNATATLTNGEMREYARRRQKVQDAWNLIGDLFKCKTIDGITPGSTCGPKIVNAMGKVHPGDTQMWEQDPFAFSSIVGQIKPDAFLTPPSLSGKVGFGTRIQSSPLSATELLTVSTGLDIIGDNLSLPGLTAPALAQPMMAPAPPGFSSGETTTLSASRSLNGGLQPIQANPLHSDAPYAPATFHNDLTSIRGYMNLMWSTYPPQLDPTKPYPALKCDPPTNRVTMAADQLRSYETFQPVCVMVNTLLEEWFRKVNGKPSCLDPKGVYCDWTPDMFVDRFVTKNIGYAAAAKELEYSECKRWTNGGDLDNPNNDIDTGIGIKLDDRKTSLALRNVLKARKEYFMQQLKNVPIRAQDHFGKLRIDKDSIGNSDFGGGYEYQLSWDLELFRGPDTKVCRMGGSTVAEFDASARLFGHKVTLLDARTAVQSNVGDLGKAKGDAHLKVVGITFFDTKDDDHYDTANNGVINLETYRSPGSYFGLTAGGDKKTVFTAAAQVSWVTITVTVGAYYKYGTQTILAATLPDPTVCSGGNSFELFTSLTPFAELGAWADVDATIIGFGAGLEVSLELLGLKIPLTTKLEVKEQEGQPKITFLAKLDLVVSSLSGELLLYIKAFGIKVATFDLVKWKGVEHTFPIFRTKDTALPVGVLTQNLVKPWGSQSNQDPCPQGKSLNEEGICT